MEPTMINATNNTTLISISRPVTVTRPRVAGERASDMQEKPLYLKIVTSTFHNRDMTLTRSRVVPLL
jgi:hypothetical protein